MLRQAVEGKLPRVAAGLTLQGQGRQAPAAAQLVEPGPPEAGVLEQPVEVGAEHPTVLGRHAVRVCAGAAAAPGQAPQGHGTRQQVGATHVDLVSPHTANGSEPVRGTGPWLSLRLHGQLLGVELGAHGEQTQSWQTGTVGFHRPCVHQIESEHLVTAAHAQHRYARSGQPGHGGGQPPLVKPDQVLQAVFGSGQDQGVGDAQGFRAVDIADADARLCGQRIKVGEIADAGQADDCHVQHCTRQAVAVAAGHGVFLVQAQIGQVRDDAEHRQTGGLFEEADAIRKEGGVATEEVDDQPRHPCPLLRRQQRQRADQGGNDTAPVDVPNQQYPGIGQFGGGHVGDVTRPQVHLCGTAGSLQHQHLVARLQAGQGVPDRPEGQFPVLAPVTAPVRVAQRAAVDDHLGGHVTAGLEQDRVHVDAGRQAGGLGLEHLCPADLAAVGCDAGVQGHVLGLEGGHAPAVLMQDAAEGGGEHALAHVGGSALKHDRSSHRSPSCRPAP